jgi:hypothetical protein
MNATTTVFQLTYLTTKQTSYAGLPLLHMQVMNQIRGACSSQPHSFTNIFEAFCFFSSPQRRKEKKVSPKTWTWHAKNSSSMELGSGHRWESSLLYVSALKSMRKTTTNIYNLIIILHVFVSSQSKHSTILYTLTSITRHLKYMALYFSTKVSSVDLPSHYGYDIFRPNLSYNRGIWYAWVVGSTMWHMNHDHGWVSLT